MFEQSLIDPSIFAAIFPIILYWVYAYICYTPKDYSTNKVSLTNVILQVFLNHFLQFTTTILSFYIFGKQEIVPVTETIFIRLSRFIFALFLLDSYQYWIHRLFHTFPSLYYYHSFHHKVYLPYSFSASFVHPLESFVLDNGSVLFASFISGLMGDYYLLLLLFALSTIKTIDDHCGLNSKWNLFHFIFENNSKFHAVHHTIQGIKYNFSQPYFVIWDKICGTYRDPNVFKFE